ncbi:MAG: hypothetical protein H0V09_03860 [Gemmatimonadetes bacterium]|nr:hypothetical protein [Gemmatimonadota bacterium]
MDETIAFHGAAPHGGEGFVLLLETPGEDGQVGIRRWASPDYTAAPVELRVSAREVRATIESQAALGWTFTLPLERIVRWLEPAEP